MTFKPVWCWAKYINRYVDACASSRPHCSCSCSPSLSFSSFFDNSSFTGQIQTGSSRVRRVRVRSVHTFHAVGLGGSIERPWKWSIVVLSFRTLPAQANVER
jgi:hypothetical protein